MWCVVYAGDKNEQKTKGFITHLLRGNACARCFSLTKNRLYKNSGVWHTVCERIFPGYVFIDTDEPETVYRILEKTPKNLLFSGSSKVCVLDKDEEMLLNSIVDENGQIGISDVHIREDKTIEFLSGPLVKMPERVKRVDLHRRFAEVQMNLPYGKESVWLGIRF